MREDRASLTFESMEQALGSGIGEKASLSGLDLRQGRSSG
jgi:hypothetical protein